MPSYLAVSGALGLGPQLARPTVHAVLTVWLLWTVTVYAVPECLKSMECRLRRPGCISECRGTNHNSLPKYDSCLKRCLDSHDGYTKDYPPDDTLDPTKPNEDASDIMDTVGMDTLVEAYQQRVAADRRNITADGVELVPSEPKTNLEISDQCVRKCVEKFIFLVEAMDPEFTGDSVLEQKPWTDATLSSFNATNIEPPEALGESAAWTVGPSPLILLSALVARW
ncbi:hypothetical protein H4R34_000888 [Dimargaris verticillata]|uniref:Uncharacterized protein n=1 Tax=Dimargaris verticillata TaxID=2761393 RepID=A0A9W8BBT3_9FUNG|nr:hypothetical protein H4R34_000888 [Dimargaris verticillata]